MEISFDPAKSERNEIERGLSFTLIEEMDWTTIIIEEDTRKEYGERRYEVLGMIEDRLHVVVFTPRGDRIHVISLRKANLREVKRYDENT